MVSVDFNFAEPTASYEYDNSDDSGMDMSPEDIGSIQKSDIVVLDKRPVKIVEVKHSQPGKHGHSKVHLVGIDIFTGRRYEDVRPVGQMIQVPKVGKKDYTVINIDKDYYVTLLDEVTCTARMDLKLEKDSDMARRMLDKFGCGQIKVTVLKALAEEKIIAFKSID